MTPDDIAADRAVIDAAPDGPWYAAYAGVWSEPRTKEDSEWDRKCPPEAMGDDDHPYWTEWEEWERANPPVIALVQIAAGDTPTTEGAEVAKFIAAARTGWPRALDALEAAQAEVERLGAMVEWLAEVIVDARDACQRAESIEPSGSPEWVESGIAMRTTVLREVRAILDRERTAHPSALDKVTDRAEKAETEITALRERVADLEGQLAMRGAP